MTPSERLTHILIQKAREHGVVGEISFIEGDVTDWLSRPDLCSFLCAHGEWMGGAATSQPTTYRYEPGPSFCCHLAVATRLMATRGSSAWFGFKLYQPGDLADEISSPTYWMHGWITDPDGTVVCSSVKSEPSLYYGVKWSRDLLRLVRDNRGHPFTELLELVVGDGKLQEQLVWT